MTTTSPVSVADEAEPPCPAVPASFLGGWRINKSGSTSGVFGIHKGFTGWVETGGNGSLTGVVVEPGVAGAVDTVCACQSGSTPGASAALASGAVRR
ncbi:hypothetical protein NHF46_16030 [Arthrobacter alpinus]|nr:hypothetical protein [Arthrobacter alpinus]